MADYSTSLGDAIKKARTKQGLTQSEVAEKLDVDIRTVRNIENGRGNPTIENLFPLVRLLHADPTEIFYPELSGNDVICREVQILLSKCSPKEAEVILSVCRSMLAVIQETDADPV